VNEEVKAEGAEGADTAVREGAECDVAIPADGGAKPASDAEAAVSAEPAPTVDLPYRVVFAVCTTDTVAVYDTTKETPVAFVSGLHYATITDAAWSPCGMKLVVSSSDGYCSALTFTESELGKVLAPEEVPEHIAHVLPSRRVLSSEKRARVAAEAAKAAAERAAQTQAPAQVDGGQTKRIAPQPVTADGPKRIAPQPVDPADGPKRIAPQPVDPADGPKRVMPTPVDPAAPVSVAVGEKRPIESADGGVEKKPQRIAPTPM